MFIGFVLPVETAVVFGGFLASRHDLDIVVLCALVFLAAVIGDSVGFEVGKHFGPRVMQWKLFHPPSGPARRRLRPAAAAWGPRPCSLAASPRSSAR